MIGIVYAIESKLPRRVVMTTDGMAELIRAAAVEDGEALIIRKSIADGTLETLRDIIAEETKTNVEDHPTGRCAVVLPETREVIDFIVADPVLDKVDEAHFLGGDCACELHATDDAKLGDKITEDGERLARVVTGDREGKVEAVEWLDPAKIPEGYVEDSHAEPGDKIDALVLTDVPSEGTVKL